MYVHACVWACVFLACTPGRVHVHIVHMCVHTGMLACVCRNWPSWVETACGHLCAGVTVHHRCVFGSGYPGLHPKDRPHCSVTQSCPTLYNPIECSPPDSSVNGISQARILEWVAISFSWGSSQPRNWTHISCIVRWILYHWATWEAPNLKASKDSPKSCLTLSISWTVACQAPLSTGFSSQEYWSRLPFPSPGELPGPGIEPRSLPHCRQMLYRLSYMGSPLIKEPWRNKKWQDPGT